MYSFSNLVLSRLYSLQFLCPPTLSTDARCQCSTQALELAEHLGSVVVADVASGTGVEGHGVLALLVLGIVGPLENVNLSSVGPLALT